MNRSLPVSVWLLGNTLGPPRCNKSHLLTMCSTMEPWKELMLVTLPGSLRPCMLLTVALWPQTVNNLSVYVSLLLLYGRICVCILNACTIICIKCSCVEMLCTYCVCRCVYLCITHRANLSRWTQQTEDGKSAFHDIISTLLFQMFMLSPVEGILCIPPNEVCVRYVCSSNMESLHSLTAAPLPTHN